jgi:hypothetical protein
MRRNAPNAVRPFKTPLVPLVPILGILVCSLMIISLDRLTQLSALTWMIVGLNLYIIYGIRNSVLGKAAMDHLRGVRSASIAGIICSIALAIFAALDFFLEKQAWTKAGSIADKEPAFPMFFVIFGGLQLLIFIGSLMAKPRTA